MRSCKGSQGFTLIELMTSIVIFGVAMSAIYSAYLSQQKAYQVTEAVTETQQNLRGAMYVLEREIRMAGYDPKGTNSFGFTSPLQSSVIVFSYDVDDSGASGATKFFRFQRNATNQTLTREIGSSGGPPPTSWSAAGEIAYRIDSVDFQYLTSSGVTTITPSSVGAVVVTLSASKDNHTRQLSTRIQCRNMGL